MFILVVAYLGGILTILSPCVLPVLPFVFARADRPFRSHGLPLLLGLAVAFAGTATLAAVGGAWVVSLNQYGRGAAIALMALFGAALLFPAWAERLSRPVVRLGNRLSDASTGPASSSRYAFVAPLLLGVGTGMLWTPCAGPILGLILTSAALRGANLGTSLLLLAYAAGAATSLAGALLFGGRLFSMLRGTLRTGENVRRIAGAAVLVGAGAIALGLDTQVLSQVPLASATRLEQLLVDRIGWRPLPLTQPQSQSQSSGQPARSGFMLTAANAPDVQRLPDQGGFPSLSGATEWINSPALTPESLRGKVVLVDFWTYSCINCLRTLPYLRAWSQKYKDAGLVVIGVHTPEFAFEKKPSNVRTAVKDLGIGFPVALDSNFAIWRAFGNRAWPAFYFIDAQGRIRHQQLGEGRYDKAEGVIQQLLAEAGRSNVPSDRVTPAGEGTQAAAGATPAVSAETYVGYAQAENFASPGGLARDRAHDYELASMLGEDQWALAGNWTVEGERAVLNRANGRIRYRFQARDLHLVLGPAQDGHPVRFRVRVDGQAPKADHGFDIDAEGNGTIDRQRLYQLVRRPRAAGAACSRSSSSIRVRRPMPLPSASRPP